MHNLIRIYNQNRIKIWIIVIGIIISITVIQNLNKSIRDENNKKNNKILYENILSKTKALKIIKICEENSIYYNVYTENGIIAKNLSYNTLYYYKDNLTKPDENRTHINIV